LLLVASRNWSRQGAHDWLGTRETGITQRTEILKMQIKE
jgi:hypothetical protein